MKNAPLVSERVVRSKGDYVVGSVGTVVALDLQRGRAQVAWDRSNKTWVKFDVIEPESIPYEIVRPTHGRKRKGGGMPWHVYRPL